MTEKQLLEKLKEVSRLLDDYQNDKIEKSYFTDYKTDIVRESEEILRKSHVVGAVGSTCGCCGGTGRG